MSLHTTKMNSLKLAIRGTVIAIDRVHFFRQVLSRYRHRTYALPSASCHSWPLKGNPKIEREKREKEERDSQKEKIKDFDFTYEKLALAEIRRNSAEVDVGPIHRKWPLAHDQVLGKLPKPRYLWKEHYEKHKKEGFPATPVEAKADLYTFLVQRDAYSRMQTIDVPKFCVGSIMAVTRADPFAPKGSLRFVGICTQKAPMDNQPGASFVLRNVIEGEPLEIRFHTFSPLIQKIEVLKHQTWNRPDLKCLRDLPPEESYVKETMQAEPYTEEPSVHKSGYATWKKRKAWLKQVYARRNRRHRDKRIQKDDPYPYKKNKDQIF